jgi:hypothetical protein
VFIAKANSGVAAQSEYADSLKQTDAYMAEYLATVKGGNATYAGYVKSTKNAISGQKALTASAKASAVAMGALNMVLNMAVTALVSAGISFLIKKLDEWIVTSDEAKKSAEELASAWEEADQKLSSTKETIDSISSEYAKLSKGVDSFGQNISLTSDEYERHNVLANQIAELLPELVTGWTDEGTAILSTKGSVEELTSAYESLIYAQNEAKAKSLGDTLETFRNAHMSEANWIWQQNGAKTKLDAARYVYGLLSTDDQENTERATAAMMENQRLWREIGEEAGLRGVEFGQEYLHLLKTYIQSLENTTELTVENVRSSIKAILEIDDMYGEFDDSVKAIISKIVQNLNSDFIAEFAEQDDPAGAVNLWIQRSIIDPFSNFDFSDIIDAKSMFDTSQISVGSYRNQYAEFLQEIAGMGLDPRVAETITESLAPDIDNLIANVQGKLQDTYDNRVLSLSLGKLVQASEISVPEGVELTWMQLLDLMDEAETAAAQTIDELSKSVQSLTEEHELLSSALSEQERNGAVSYETYQKLIAANSDYADSFDYVNGALQLNADRAYAVADASSDLAYATADAARAQKQAEYDKVAKDLEEVNAQLQEMDDLGYQNNLYDSLLAQKSALEASVDLIGEELQAYQAVTGQIKSMTDIYARFLRSQATANQGALYDAGSGTIKETLLGGIKSQALNTDEMRDAIEFYVGAGDVTQAGLERRSEEAREIAERYFTEDDPLIGLGNFQQDLLSTSKMGDLAQFFSNGPDGFRIADGVTAVEIANQMGMSVEAIYSMLKKIEEYDADAQLDWNQLFPEGTDGITEQESLLQQAADKLTSDTETYVQAVEDAARRVAEANLKLASALTPNTPESQGTPEGATPEGTPAPEITPPTQQLTLTLTLQEGELESISSQIQEGVNGGIQIITNVGEGANELELLAQELENLPIGDVTITLTDNGDTITKLSTITEALTLIRAGAIVPITITLPNDTTRETLDALNVAIMKLPPQVQCAITVDASAVPDICNLEDREILVTLNGSTVTNSVDAINAETARLEDRFVTFTAVDGTTRGYSANRNFGGGQFAEPPLPNPQSARIPREGGPGSKESTPTISTEGIEETTRKLNIFQVLWLRIKELFGGEEYVVPALIAPAAQSGLDEAQIGLEEIADTVIPDKQLNIDESQARADLESFENRADDPITKPINITYSAGGGGFAKGTKNAPDGTVLVDEKGAELIEHQDGTYELGTNQGARFTNVDSGDVIHDKEETKKILQRGENPTSLVGNRYESSWNLPSPVVNVTNTSSNKKYTSSSTSLKNYIDQLFDWIEVRVKRLQEVTDKWTRQIQKSIGYIAKNKAIDDTIYSITNQINALSEGAVRYQKQADEIAKKSKLSAGIISKIQNGTMDISIYGDSTKEKIKEYQTWYEKALDARNAVEDLITKQDELNRQKIDNVITQYEQFIGVVDNASRKAQSTLDLRIATGKEITRDDYASLMNAQIDKISLLREEQSVLEAEMQKQIAEGTLVQRSDAWYEYNRSIAEIELSLIEANQQMVEFTDALENIGVTNLGYLLTELQKIQSTLQGTLDMAEAQGRTATSEMYKGLIANGNDVIANLQEQNALLIEQQATLDVSSEKYQGIQEAINGNNESIRDMMNSQEQWNDAILDLRIGELTRLKDELDKTNSAYQRQRDLQQAIEDLEKAKSQRSRRILKDGQFVFEQNQEDVAEKQRNLDEILHKETLNKIDDAIDAIEDLKPENNVYGAVGVTPVSLSDLYPSASIEGLINAIVGSARTGVDLSDMAETIGGSANIMNDNRTNTVTVSPGAITISLPNGDPYEVIRVLQAELSEAFTIKGYQK